MHRDVKTAQTAGGSQRSDRKTFGPEGFDVQTCILRMYTKWKVRWAGHTAGQQQLSIQSFGETI